MQGLCCRQYTWGQCHPWVLKCLHFRLWGCGGPARVLGQPVVGSGWCGLFVLGVIPPPKDLPSKTAIWVTAEPLPQAILFTTKHPCPWLGVPRSCVVGWHRRYPCLPLS